LAWGISSIAQIGQDQSSGSHLLYPFFGLFLIQDHFARMPPEWSGSSALSNKPSIISLIAILGLCRNRILDRHFWLDYPEMYRLPASRAALSLLGSFSHRLGDELHHLFGVLVELVVMLREDEEVAGFLENDHNL
jgi:hypothetical protein